MLQCCLFQAPVTCNAPPPIPRPEIISLTRQKLRGIRQRRSQAGINCLLPMLAKPLATRTSLPITQSCSLVLRTMQFPNASVHLDCLPLQSPIHDCLRRLQVSSPRDRIPSQSTQCVSECVSVSLSGSLSHSVSRSVSCAAGETQRGALIQNCRLPTCSSGLFPSSSQRSATRANHLSGLQTPRL